MTGKDVLPEKYLLVKAAAIIRIEYSPLGKELKKRTSVAEKQYQTFESNKNEEKPTIKRSRAKSNLVYNKDFTFYKYYEMKNLLLNFLLIQNAFIMILKKFSQLI